MDSVSQYLPPEIITNILVRLPVKSLVRFQCVCKPRKNLIKNPSFVLDHLQHSRNQNPLFLLECCRSYSPLRWHLRLVDCKMQIRRVQKATFLDSSDGASIAGSCNGLLCVEIYRYKQSPPSSLLLWNPATTEIRHVPRTRTECYYFDECVTGFGFSPIADDYKIVRFYTYFYSGVVKQVEVFSLSKGSWKEIDIGNLKEVKLNPASISGNGAIFWSGEILEDEEDIDGFAVIVSFDIAKEVFTLIPIDNFNGEANLTFYENKFAVLCDIWGAPDESDFIDLLVMEEGTCALGERRSWTKRCTSIPNPKKLDPVIIWRNQIVFRPFEDKKRKSVLNLMNITTNEVDMFVISYRGSVRGIYNYVESLVSVGSDCIEESGS